MSYSDFDGDSFDRWLERVGTGDDRRVSRSRLHEEPDPSDVDDDGPLTDGDRAAARVTPDDDCPF